MDNIQSGCVFKAVSTLENAVDQIAANQATQTKITDIFYEEMIQLFYNK